MEAINQTFGLNSADLLIIIVILFSGLMSIRTGLIAELTGIFAWIVAGFMAWIFGDFFSPMLEPHISSLFVREAAARLLMLIIVLMAFALLRYILVSLVSMTGLSGTDRFLGFVYGLFRGALIITLLVFIFKNFDFIRKDETVQKSKLLPTFLELSNQVMPTVNKIINKGMETVDKAKELKQSKN